MSFTTDHNSGPDGSSPGERDDNPNSTDDNDEPSSTDNDDSTGEQECENSAEVYMYNFRTLYVA
jgi:hypothetical protein